MAADNGDNWAKKEEEHPCLSVFIRVLAKVSGSEWEDSMGLRTKLQEWADELRAIAQNSLLSAASEQDKANCRRVRRLAAEIFAATTTRDAQEVLRLYSRDLGYVTPKVVGNGAIFNDRNEILLIRRQDNGLWALPGGALEVGETAAEGVCREVWEETGLGVRVTALTGIHDSRLCGTNSPHHQYHLVFLCEPLDDAKPQVSEETLDVGWFSEGALPPLAPGHPLRIAQAFRFHRGEMDEPFFDGKG